MGNQGEFQHSEILSHLYAVRNLSINGHFQSTEDKYITPLDARHISRKLYIHWKKSLSELFQKDRED